MKKKKKTQAPKKRAPRKKRAAKRPAARAAKRKPPARATLRNKPKKKRAKKNAPHMPRQRRGANRKVRKARKTGHAAKAAHYDRESYRRAYQTPGKGLHAPYPRANGKKKRRLKNPIEAAAAKFVEFHGRGPESITDVTRTIREHTVLTGIGKLVKLEVAAIDGRSVVELTGFRGALLAMDEKGTQLYIEGGDQSVNLRDFGITAPHEDETLGSVLVVEYDTQKDHLGKDGGKATYRHKFGGHGSRLPLLGYDVRNKLLSFSGGGYSLPDVGIDG